MSTDPSSTVEWARDALARVILRHDDASKDELAAACELACCEAMWNNRPALYMRHLDIQHIADSLAASIVEGTRATYRTNVTRQFDQLSRHICFIEINCEGDR